MYDARSNKSSSGGNVGFALIAIGVIAAVFIAVLLMPSSNGKAGGPKALAASVDTSSQTLEAVFEGRAAKTYLAALGKVDPGAVNELERRVQKRRASDVPILILNEHISDVMAAHADTLAQANAKHLDGMLVLTRDRLRDASRSRSKWCEGSHYAAMTEMSEPEMMAFVEEMTTLNEPVQDFILRMNTLMLEAILDARENPVRHGALNASDEAAMQGLVMSMVSDPQVMPLIMQTQAGASPESVLAKLNICELGATAMLAIKTLPQDTKGRVWAEAIRNSGGGLDQLKGLSGF